MLLDLNCAGTSLGNVSAMRRHIENSTSRRVDLLCALDTQKLARSNLLGTLGAKSNVHRLCVT